MARFLFSLKKELVEKHGYRVVSSEETNRRWQEDPSWADNFHLVEVRNNHMQPQRHQHMFNFQYVKSSKQITEKMSAKIIQLKSKIEERKKRIKGIREENKITDAVYIDLLEQARDAQRKNAQVISYSVSNKMAGGSGGPGGLAEETFTIGAGVVNSLLTESDMLRSEGEEVTRYELIVRNLEDLENTDTGKKVGHRLQEEELRYLGF